MPFVPYPKIALAEEGGGGGGVMLIPPPIIIPGPIFIICYPLTYLSDITFFTVFNVIYVKMLSV